MNTNLYSPLTHHLAVATGRRLESSRATDIHSGAPIDAGTNHQVCLPKPARDLANDEWYSFMAHPETLLPMPTIDDPIERFISVIKFYLSGWHIKPPYVACQRLLTID